MAQKKKKTTNYQQQQQQQSPAENEQEQSNKINNNNNNTELSQKLARLLSQEPSQPVNSSNHISPQPLNLSDLNLQLKSIIDQKLAIFNEKIKLYQNQLSQLRRELETKDQLLKELQSIRQTDAEQLLEQHKQVAETRYAACLKLSNTREEAMKEYKQKVMDLNAKLSRVYSGEEERDRQRLEEEKEALVQENQRLKAAHDTQRKRRKEAERVAQQAHAMAEEAVQEQLQEANDEVKTLKKMLATETENSKAMIVQLNHLRTNASSSTSGHHSNNSHTNQQNSGPNNTGMEKTIEDLKQRLSVIGDFTGLEILSSTPDKRGVIYDCIFGDIVHRGLALHFKLQFHPDGTCSYTPSLDPDRDSPTIKIIPDFLQTFVRFDLKACGHVYWKLFQAFNLQDT